MITPSAVKVRLASLPTGKVLSRILSWSVSDEAAVSLNGSVVVATEGREVMSGASLWICKHGMEWKGKKYGNVINSNTKVDSMLQKRVT